MSRAPQIVRGLCLFQVFLNTGDEPMMREMGFAVAPGIHALVDALYSSVSSIANIFSFCKTFCETGYVLSPLITLQISVYIISFMY